VLRIDDLQDSYKILALLLIQPACEKETDLFLILLIDIYFETAYKDRTRTYLWIRRQTEEVNEWNR